MLRLTCAVFITFLLTFAPFANAGQNEAGQDSETGRFQIVAPSDDSIFLVDSEHGQVWVISAEIKGEQRLIRWAPIAFEKNGPIPKDGSLFVTK